MWRIVPLLLLAAVMSGTQKFATRKPADEFIGAWKLVSYERRTPAGDLEYPMGAHPVGRLAYDPSGRMSAQLMRADRPHFQDSPASAEEKIAAFDGYVAYYGTYTVNPAGHTVVHHVEASLNPNWVGTDLTRSYEFSNSQLILSTAEIRLVWERAR
jgi:hypothetical protein